VPIDVIASRAPDPADARRAVLTAMRSQILDHAPIATDPRQTLEEPFSARRSPPDLERDDFSSIRHPALASCWSMIFSENRYPPRIRSGAGFFGIML
jgi:hypothetical protein